MVVSMSVTLANMNKQFMCFFCLLSRNCRFQRIHQHHLPFLKRPCNSKARIAKRPRRTIRPYTKAMREVVMNGRELDDTHINLPQAILKEQFTNIKTLSFLRCMKTFALR